MLTAIKDNANKVAEAFESFGKAAHTPRPRRSRQCRGKRARNYVRALARVSAGSRLNDDTADVFEQAGKTGALASHRRATERKLAELRRR